jgi:5-methylcytosine-specific restriction endonuclease McrA
MHNIFIGGFMKTAYNAIDMTGKTYGSWKILEIGPLKGKIRYWKAVCLDCNKQFEVHGPNVRLGLSERCVDCGIKVCTKQKIGKTKSKKSTKQLAEHYLMRSMKSSARNREKQWELSKDEFLNLIYKNCTYCGALPNTTSNPTKGMSLAKSRDQDCFITYNGIDRVDSSKGYILGNVVTCCEHCNKAKLDRTSSEFLAWAERLVNYQKSLKT